MRDSELLKDLTAARDQPEKAGKAKKNVCPVWDHSDLMVDSWKFNEWDYYNEKLSLPIRARGLFLIEDLILLRGYDKFFSIGETSSTDWDVLAEQSSGPYEVTLKENGCKIMMSGYDGKLIVTSKHSSGPRVGEVNKNHSLIAKRWVQKHLIAVNKSEKELAEDLERMDVTGVGELCDDEFEEHVLAYPPDRAGIYFNGLNKNSREFQSLEFAHIDAFSAKYGFRKTKHLVFDDLGKLRTFLEACAETGSWDGQDVEGFVVRCKLNGKSFFFKYKFEEPYLMYRSWREVTKFVLKNPLAVPKMRYHREATIQYLQFLRTYMSTHPELKHQVLVEGKGIIALREEFLKHSEKSAVELAEMGSQGIPKYVVLPVATIGCGKTTLALSLHNLFDWGHVQSDNLTGKNKSLRLANLAVDALETKDVVIIDRNNHQFRERKETYEDLLPLAATRGYAIKYICLNFLPKGPTKKTWQITHSRVLDRKNNHQTIRDMDEKKIKGIMRGFEGRFEPVTPALEPDTMFDVVIDMDISKSPADNLWKIMDVLNSQYDFSLRPTQDQMCDAVYRALNHKVELPISQKKVKLPAWQYFALSVDPQLVLGICQTRVAEVELWQRMVAGTTAQLQSEFHITLCHRKSHPEQMKAYKGEFQSYLSNAKEAGVLQLPVKETVSVIEIAWNEKIMALRVDIAGQYQSGNLEAHITIGMVKGTSPHQANDMLGDELHSAVALDKPIVLEGTLFAYR